MWISEIVMSEYEAGVISLPPLLYMQNIDKYPCRESGRTEHMRGHVSDVAAPRIPSVSKRQTSALISHPNCDSTSDIRNE
jgi:hypothetical protein